jgi:hypothetical protein
MMRPACERDASNSNSVPAYRSKAQQHTPQRSLSINLIKKS